MFLIVGIIVVFSCVLGGYAALGGNLHVLWQPFELVIIGGAAIGAYIIGSPKIVLQRTWPALKMIASGSPYRKKHFIELLLLQYALFRLANRKGMLALEKHIENPEDSPLFEHFPYFKTQEPALRFLCDHLRLLTLGGDNPYQMEDLMELEIETAHNEHSRQATALRTMADALPALGIVAAVLGVIKTMGAITEPPEILGQSIGGALVGTFLGVFLAYGFVGPMASSLDAVGEDKDEYYRCMKAGLVAYLNGYGPAICVEFARKAIQSNFRPTFYEIESELAELPVLE